MKKALHTLTLLAGFAATALAQTQYEINERSGWRERIFTGGNLGLQFGNYTLINISPTLGYRLTNEVSTGVGVSYIYTKVRSVSRTHYGGSVFARANIYEPFFVQVQYEYLSVELRESRRVGLRSFLVGGGVQQPLGGNAIVSFTVMYNLSYREGEPSAYNSPVVVGGGITLGF